MARKSALTAGRFAMQVAVHTLPSQLAQNFNVVFQPIPGSSQEVAIDTRADETLYCGNRGCGKSVAQLMCFYRNVGVGYGAFWRGVILDTIYDGLDAVIQQAQMFFLNQNDGCRWLGKGTYKFVWKTGEELLFRVAPNKESTKNFLGRNLGFIGFNELTKWQKPDVYDYLLPTLRTGYMGHKIDLPTKMFCTTNPFGLGRHWVKRRFINPAPYGHVVDDIVEVPNFDGTFEKVVSTKIALRGMFTENPYYSLRDRANLIKGTRHNKLLYEAWVNCNWDALSGEGAIDDIWDSDIHVIGDFPIPSGWKLNRAFDWGSTQPFAVGWFATSDGEEFEYAGRTKCYPKGSVIMFYEWYGAREIGMNEGLRLSPKQIAQGIKKCEEQFVNKKIIQGKVFPGPADNQIANVNRIDQETIERTMSREKVRWTRADKSKGSRVLGLQILRTRLENAVSGEGEGFFVQRRCQATIELLPMLARDDKLGEDIADGQEDHLYDMIRYRLLDRKMGAPNVNFSLR